MTRTTKPRVMPGPSWYDYFRGARRYRHFVGPHAEVTALVEATLKGHAGAEVVETRNNLRTGMYEVEVCMGVDSGR